MNEDMKSDLKVLEHLSCVIECLSLDYTGEAKHEITMLAESIKEGKMGSESASLVETLESAHELLMSERKGEAASILSRVSRQLWKKVLQHV